MQAINGQYNDGTQSKSYAASISYKGQAKGVVLLHCEAFDSDRYLHIDELKISSRLGNTPREVRFGENEIFVSDDNDAIDEMLNTLTEKHQVSMLHRLEGNLVVVFCGLVVTVLFVALLGLYGIPKGAEYIAYQIPQSWLDEHDSSLYLLDEAMFEPSNLDPKEIERLSQQAAPYLAAHKDLSPKLIFRSLGEEQPNAFALPDGHIVFTDGFVKLIEHDEEFLSVLFHELGHLEHRHLLRRTLQDSFVLVAIILITGDVNSVDFLAALPTLLLDMSYSRDFERESDWFALEQMERHQIPLDHFATIMNRLESYYSIKQLPADQDGEGESQESAPPSRTDTKGKGLLTRLPDFLSTHPATEERVELVEKFRAQLD